MGIKQIGAEYKGNALVGYLKPDAGHKLEEKETGYGGWCGHTHIDVFLNAFKWIFVV